MRKRNLVSFLIIVPSLVFALSTTAFAATLFNESLDTFNYSRYLPVVFGGTLIIEAIIIMLMSDVKRIVNVSYSVLVANVASFAITRVAWGLLKNDLFYTDMFVFGNGSEKWLVAAGCFVASLIIELPILFLMLRPFTKKFVRLMLSAAAANLITIFAVTVFEIQLYNSLIA